MVKLKCQGGRGGLPYKYEEVLVVTCRGLKSSFGTFRAYQPQKVTMGAFALTFRALNQEKRMTGDNVLF